jgi:hypothetical protein
MSDHDPILERLSRAADAASSNDQRAVTFARGLVLGALVGAAIAGSTIWQRRHGRPSPAARIAAEIGALTQAEPQLEPKPEALPTGDLPG